MTGEAMPEQDTPEDAMAAEFDTVAEWTAEAALALGPDHFVPAGCRGSAQPAGFDWLLDRMALTPGDALLDVGAGVGGPAAYAARERSVRPLLVEPALGACRAAAQLFDLPVVCADAAALPLPDASFGALWSLGVLCTTEDHVAVLRESTRVLRPGGRAGLLVFVARVAHPDGEPEGNHFPTHPALRSALSAAGLHVLAETEQDALAPLPDSWSRRADAVEDEVQRRHGDDPAWRAAQEESDAVGALIKAGTVRGVLLVVERGTD
jgi:SAM-dependent methyltransferase